MWCFYRVFDILINVYFRDVRLFFFMNFLIFFYLGFKRMYLVRDDVLIIIMVIFYVFFCSFFICRGFIRKEFVNFVKFFLFFCFKDFFFYEFLYFFVLVDIKFFYFCFEFVGDVYVYYSYMIIVYIFVI